MNNGMIRRHTRGAIFMHWFNAACWLFLLATGLGLIANPKLSPVGTGWSSWMHGLFVKGEYLLYAHVAVGLLWALVFIVYMVVNPRQHFLRFVREILTISPSRDFKWLFKKMILMTLGPRFLKKLGMDAGLPDQGFYNVGQKLFAIPAAFGGVIIAATGIIMVLSRFTAVNTALVLWSIFIHFLVVGLTFAGLLIHVYMAAIASEERPAFFSMFTGNVPASFARHHNRLWYQELTVQDKALKN